MISEPSASVSCVCPCRCVVELVPESVADPAKYYQNNRVNTLGLLEAMRREEINRFVFSSTCATYGVPQQVPITENERS